MKRVTIVINNHRKVFAVREEFSRLFPNLKLGFHAKPNTSDGPHPDKLVHNSSTTIGDCRNHLKDGELEVHGEWTAGELKAHFRNDFGLETEIYRRTGTEWYPVDESVSLNELNTNNQE